MLESVHFIISCKCQHRSYGLPIILAQPGKERSYFFAVQFSSPLSAAYVELEINWWCCYNFLYPSFVCNYNWDLPLVLKSPRLSKYIMHDCLHSYPECVCACVHQCKWACLPAARIIRLCIAEVCPVYPQWERGNEAISGGAIISSDGPTQDHLAGDLEGTIHPAAILLLLQLLFPLKMFFEHLIIIFDDKMPWKAVELLILSVMLYCVTACKNFWVLH